MQSSSLMLITCFIVMFIVTWSRSIEKNNRLFDSNGSITTDIGALLSMHVAGILWFGIIPMIVSDQRWEIFFNSNEVPVRWIILIASLLFVIIVTGERAGRQVNLNFYELPVGFAGSLPIYFILRVVFLCAYEIFFRGILLFRSVQWFGIIPAIAISTLLTVLIHWFTNKKEMIGCVPFGIILSIACIELNTIWPAILLHIALSFSYEIPPVRKLIFNLKLSR